MNAPLQELSGVVCNEENEYVMVNHHFEDDSQIIYVQEEVHADGSPIQQYIDVESTPRTEPKDNNNVHMSVARL